MDFLFLKIFERFYTSAVLLINNQIEREFRGGGESEACFYG
jgi:hypothetical protein